MTVLIQSSDDSASLTSNPSKRKHSRLSYCSKSSTFLHRRSPYLFKNFWSPSNLLTLSSKFFIVKLFSSTFSSNLSTSKSRNLINWFWSFIKTFNEFISSFDQYMLGSLLIFLTYFLLVYQITNKKINK